jgi:hypothetical protein
MTHSRRASRLILLLSLPAALLAASARADEWQPFEGPLTTPWTKDVSPDKVAWAALIGCVNSVGLVCW